MFTLRYFQILLALSLTVLPLLNGRTAVGQVAPVQASNLQLNRYGAWGDDGQGALVTCMTLDRRGHVWVGTEDTGIWVNNSTAPGGNSWTGYSAETGLADSTCTALLSDTEGRVWAGTSRHGVSVFNGRVWKNYDITNGPLGNHIFALAENPIDHSVWIATDNGISRYDQSGGTWTYLTKADGIPSNQPSAIAFDETGTAYIGTQCDGIGISTLASGYHIWRSVTGPYNPTHAGGGAGLPSSLINCISVSHGVIYAGTDWGLAQSTDSGTSWHYIRGSEWQAVARGEYPAQVDTLNPSANATLLSDYVTCLCQDESGNLWVGHRDYGAEVFETATFQRTGQTTSSVTDYVTSLLPTNVGMLFGALGGGVSVLSTDPMATHTDVAANNVISDLPVPADPPTAADMESWQKQIEAPSATIKPGDAYYLGDDWETQGNWVSHYGNQWALLCESWDGSQNDFFTDNRISSGSFLGPTSNNGDGLRSWLADPDSKSRSSLYDPLQGKRPVSNWNDNAEAYSITAGGGDLWYSITVPEGVYRLATYFYNNDGDSGGNRSRDYLEEIRPYTADTSKVTTADKPIAMARIVDFRSGVYKSFVICGPASYDVRVNRNGSLNGMISGYFLDKLAGPPDASDRARPPWLHGVDYTAPVIAADGGNSLWASLDRGYRCPAALPFEQEVRVFAYRAALATGGQDLLEAMRWQLHYWLHQDDLKFDVVAAKAFNAGK
jgi:hypothetical protein